MTKSLTETGASRLILGTMRLGSWGAQLNNAQYIELLEGTSEAGIDTIDLADIYGGYTQERDLGNAFAEQPQLREQYSLITKCGICRVCPSRPQYSVKHYNTSKSHILESVDNSLRDLRTDRIEMLLLHRPDALLDADEVADAFHMLQTAGKVLAFGVSNFSPAQFELLNSRFPLVTNQVEVHPMQLNPFQDGTLDQLQRLRLKPQAWSPLGGGALFQSTSENERNQRIRKAALDLGQKYNAPLDQIILAWLMRHPSGIRPVLGTTKLKRILSAVHAQKIKLENEDWYTLWSASTGKPVP